MLSEDISIDNMHCVDDWDKDMDVEWGEYVLDTKFGINDSTAIYLVAATFDMVESIFNKYHLTRYN